MIKEWIADYNPQNEEEIVSALREIMQELVLAGLSRTNFFEKAAFYGGTALRIFYKLDRFSEDLDFSLLRKDPDFKLQPYFAAIIAEFQAAGITVSINEKHKSVKKTIDSAFLKSETLWQELVLDTSLLQTGLPNNRLIKIKLEIDCQPPEGFETEELLLLRPFSFYVKCFAAPYLFAGKMHALLFRKWKNRVKGRDWYDLEWYIKSDIALNMQHFLVRAQESGDWTHKKITQAQLIDLLKQKINEVSFSKVKEDVVKFIKDDETLKIWSANYFLQLSKQLKLE
jgi:predicted nucleotidyltransferase component of viral defense system